MKGCSKRLGNQGLPRILFQGLVRSALEEDLGNGDVTTWCCIDSGQKGQGRIIAKEDGVLAGLFVAKEAFRQVDEGLALRGGVSEGSRFQKGEVLLEIQGATSSILMAERVALNFLQRLCGIATATSSYVSEISGYPCTIVDTRKTTPGLRLLEKYAVRMGGGHNHRFNLSDGILIKDNHIAACGSVAEAIERARNRAPHTLKIEVEVSTLRELEDAISAGADIVMLDNMSLSDIKDAVSLARRLNSRVILEVSGGVTLENVRDVAATGVDIISSGALTHSYKSIDLSLELTV
ncbi:MAG: carboxylating nicotinate-nucleotide diphosphorylase [Thermodesulfobacteria bacterium]|nr:carboxylating nicotinate-nucleotide diphosphorylase [Thermodesulfobacteriota bacterium]